MLATSTASLLAILDVQHEPPTPLADAAIRVGRFAALDVGLCDGSHAEARRLARQLARRGTLALLIHSSEQGCAMAVSLDPVAWTAMTAPFERDLVVRRLLRARRDMGDAPPLAQAVAYSQALDVDAAGRRTFRTLRGFLDRAVSLLPSSVPAVDRHGWALVQLTRLLFLRFVESEGWLAANPRFLADAVNECLATNRDPARDLLHPLFFGTLNMAPEKRSRFARRLGAIPFLNGGLFEPHVLERRHRFELPLDYWRDLCDVLVDTIDVTLDDAAEGGRVTPEMLGRVFEGVMHPEERRRDGTFYTPPALVDAIVREAIAQHLATRLGRDATRIAAELDDPDPILSRALLDVTVLDPAVGSGAFLVGALALLHGPGPRQSGRVALLVGRRLHGVDRHPDAVRLTELRLWLEVLRSMRGRSPGEVPPLPNLDATIRAGDTLLDPVRGATVSCRNAALLDSRQRALRHAHGIEKRMVLRQIRAAERDAVIAVLRSREAGLERDIRETLDAAREPTLLGDGSGLSRARQRRILLARDERRQVRQERRRIQRDGGAPLFAAEAAFAPVFAERRGFDLVIGNPPWVRAERLPRATREALLGRYRWWRSAGDGWRHLPDLSVAFIERGHELLAPGGTMALLVPAKLATVDYATRCRVALATHATLHCVTDLSTDRRAVFDATTYPLAIVASKRAPEAVHEVRLGLESAAQRVPQREWRAATRWSLGSPSAQRLATRLADRFPRFGEHAMPCLGLKTGANDVFLNPPSALSAWCRHAIRGRDVRALDATPKALLLWPADANGEPWSVLPEAVADFLEAHRGRLQRRADLRDERWWRLFRTAGATAPHRVVWGDLASRLEAAIPSHPSHIPLNSCYVAAARNADEARTLVAWLNATPVRALARLGADPAAGGFARFGARTVAALPLPSGVLHDRELGEIAAAPFGQDTQGRLDRRAAEWLELSTAECDVLAPLAAHRR